MRHALVTEVKATAKGTFTALVSAYSEDREGDTILPGAFKNTIARWAASGKRIPVVWQHHTHDPDNIVGWVDPATVKETDDGLEASGQIDLSTDRGKSVFRLLQQDSMSWSFGYVIPPDGRTKDNNLSEVDLLEITVTPVPANADTRTLAVKTLDVLLKRAEEASDRLEEVLERTQAVVEPPAAAEETGDEFQSSFYEDERTGVKSGRIKAAWTTDYYDQLPDSAFLVIEGGGSRDDTGRTEPRHKRWHPYRDADGRIDVPHLKNAVSLLPEGSLLSRATSLLEACRADLPEQAKETLVEYAERALEQVVTDGPTSKGVTTEELSDEPTSQASAGSDPEIAEWDSALLDARST